MEKSGKTAKRKIRTNGRSAGRQPTAPRPIKPAGPSDGGSSGDVAESPYMPGDEVSVVLTGHWSTGGLLEVHSGGRPLEAIHFSRAPWSVLAYLVLAAIRSQSTHWFNSYVATRKLADALESRGILKVGTPEKIHALINRIRAEIAKSALPRLLGPDGLAGKEWAASLIRSRKGHGYRIALPAKSLRLFIGETMYDSNGGQASKQEGSRKAKARQQE